MWCLIGFHDNCSYINGITSEKNPRFFSFSGVFFCHFSPLGIGEDYQNTSSRTINSVFNCCFSRYMLLFNHNLNNKTTYIMKLYKTNHAEQSGIKLIHVCWLTDMSIWHLELSLATNEATSKMAVFGCHPRILSFLILFKSLSYNYCLSLQHWPRSHRCPEDCKSKFVIVCRQTKLRRRLAQ